jgi:hypothetical protein
MERPNAQGIGKHRCIPFHELMKGWLVKQGELSLVHEHRGAGSVTAGGV